jgi:thiamine monophosphate synthase
MTGLYWAVQAVLKFPTLVIGAVDYAPIITACVTGICCIVVVCNIFALLRVFFK